MDLSHEIDLAVYLFGPVQSITGAYGQMSDVLVDAEDWVDMTVEHESGVLSSIQIDMAADRENRFVEVVGPQYGKLIDQNANPVDNDKAYEKQIDYFFENLGKPMTNDLGEAAHTFRHLMAFKVGGQ